MSWLRRTLVKLGIVKMLPHEKAALGLGTWGRQPDSLSSGNPFNIEAKTEPQATIKMRVYRAETDTWEEVQ